MTPNAILDLTEVSDMTRSNDSQWQAVMARDANQDGSFVFAVSSTGIYCRPSCPSRRPRRENVSFFRKPDEAEKAGYRACLRCRPKAMGGNKQAEMVKAVCRYIERHLDEPVTLSRLGSEFRQSPFHLQRSFKRAIDFREDRLDDRALPLLGKDEHLVGKRSGPVVRRSQQRLPVSSKGQDVLGRRAARARPESRPCTTRRDDCDGACQAR